MEKTWPISKYVGKFPNGYWEFVEEFVGTEEQVWPYMANLESKDKPNKYRHWDCR